MNSKNNTSTNTNTAVNQSNKELPEQLMRRLEAKGEHQAKQLITSSVPVEQAQKSILNIMKEGEKEFVQNTGRYMTYGEMRQLYG
jgi:hypothetical protein